MPGTPHSLVRSRLVSYLLATALLLSTSLAFAACAPRGPIIDTGTRPPDVGGTVSGIVRSNAGNAPIAGRRVTAVNLTTNERIDATTASNGGYTIKLARGKYRLEVELQVGEMVIEQPAELEINTSDVDSGRHFVVGRR